MKKKIIAVMALMMTAMVSMTGCDLLMGLIPSEKPSPVGDGKHTIHPDGIGGEGILDDGGDIDFSDPTFLAVGVKTEGEHQIIIGDENCTGSYELFGGAVDTATWSSGFTEGEVYRIRCGATNYETLEGEYGVIFTFDTSRLVDVSKVGVLVTLINNRAYTMISVSTDKTNWTEIGYGEGGGVKGDYTLRTETLLGKANTDANLYSCYYELGKYAVASQPLYVKCGASTFDSGLASKVGTDVIGLVSFFDSLEVVYEEF